MKIKLPLSNFFKEREKENRNVYDFLEIIELAGCLGIENKILYDNINDLFYYRSADYIKSPILESDTTSEITTKGLTIEIDYDVVNGLRIASEIKISAQGDKK